MVNLSLVVAYYLPPRREYSPWGEELGERGCPIQGVPTRAFAVLPGSEKRSRILGLQPQKLQVQADLSAHLKSF